MNKSLKIIIAILILVLVIVLGAGGYLIVMLSNKTEDSNKGNSENYIKTEENIILSNKTEDSNKDNLENLKENNKKEESSLIKDNSKEIVYVYSNKQIEDTTEEPAQIRSFITPQININSAYAEKINKEIIDKINSAYEEGLQCKKDDGPVFYDFRYKYYINNDVLSLLVADDTFQNNNIVYYIYNINIKTGKEVTNEEIIKLKGVSNSEFSNKLSDTLKSEVPSPDAPEFVEMKMQDVIKAQNEKTLSSENCSPNNVQMFLNEKNEICVLGTIYIPAGSGEYKKIINLDKKQIIEHKDLFENK